MNRRKNRLNSLGLTETETKYLALLHLSDQQIAERLGITHGGVRTQLSRIFRYLGATSRTDAMCMALAAGEIKNPHSEK